MFGDRNLEIDQVYDFNNKFIVVMDSTSVFLLLMK